MHITLGALLIDIVWNPNLYVREQRLMRLRHPIRYKQWKQYAWVLGYLFRKQMSVFEQQIWQHLMDYSRIDLTQDKVRCILFNSVEDFEP